MQINSFDAIILYTYNIDKMQVGESVIAQVLIENEPNWMLAEIKHYHPDSEEYLVMDLVPD